MFRLHPIRLALLLLTVLFQNTSAATGDWPQWRGPQRDDVSAESGLLASWPEDGPPRKWLFRNCGIGYAGPAIVEGRLYIMGGREGYAQLICLDTTDGRELWATNLGPIFENSWGDGPRSTPTVDGQLIYAMTAKGNLVCLRKDNGSVVWNQEMTDLGGRVPIWGYSESPLVFQDLVLCTPGGEQGAIVAMDKLTGEIRWRCEELTDMAHYSSIVLMQHGGKTAGVQLLETQLVGIALSDGKLLWSTPWPGSTAVVPTPLVRGNQVYATSSYGAGCKLLTIGNDFSVDVDYENKIMVNHHGGVILVEDHVYGYSDRKGWTCQDFATGEYVWRDKSSLGKGAIAYADDHFYCLSEDQGEVVLIDATTDGWQEKGRFVLKPQSELRKPRGRIWVHPVIAGGRLYLRDQDLVYCYDVSAQEVAARPVSATGN